MKLTVLGSGSPEAYSRRASSGYLIETGNDKILFDCGGGVFDNLIRTGLRPSDITHVFFSHLHSDHMMDYARLIHAAWDEGGAQIKVIGPKPIQFVTDGMFGPNGVLSYDIRARTELKPSQQVWVARGGTLPRPWPSPSVQEIEPGFECSEPDWTLRSCEVPHVQPIFACVAYSFEAEGKKFVYSGDAAQCANLKTLAKGADVLLHWCYRLDDESAHPALAAMTPTPSEIGKLARQAGVGSLILSHFRRRADKDDSLKKARASAGAKFPGTVEIAEDLAVYEI